MSGNQPWFGFGKLRFISVKEGWLLSLKYLRFYSVPLLNEWDITFPSRGLCYFSYSFGLEITPPPPKKKKSTK
jgi:hypothetical protein